MITKLVNFGDGTYFTPIRSERGDFVTKVRFTVARQGMRTRRIPDEVRDTIGTQLWQIFWPGLVGEAEE